MNIQDLRKINSFKSADESNDTRRYTAGNAAVNMLFYAKELFRNFEDYEKADKNSRIAQVLFSAIRDNLNNYVQAFMDCAIVLCDSSSTTLRSLIRSFLSEYEMLGDMKSWVEFLIRRNDLIHDYLSYDFLNDELYNALLNYSDCVIELADFIQRELKNKGLLDTKVRR